MDTKIEAALNSQVQKEAQSSHIYLAMAVWAETQGLDGSSAFLYQHAEEERLHMLKLVKFINERGGKAVIPSVSAPKAEYKSLGSVFQAILDHETIVSQNINEIVHICLEAKDYATHHFMQWYVAEQIEEEAMARKVIDRLNLAGDDKGALYLFDRDISALDAEAHNNA